MLMVILGAGASYDSWPSRPPDTATRRDEPWRPPLANELFLDLDDFRRLSSDFPRCQTLLPYLVAQPDVEATLETFRDEAIDRPWRLQQLLAIQYYIKSVVTQCQNAWLARSNGVTNYRLLVDQVQPLNDVCFVTFNYDTLLENALDAIGIQFPSITSYVSGGVRLFKPHGSIDWRGWVPARYTNSRGPDHPRPNDLIVDAEQLSAAEPIITTATEELQASERHYYLPALSVPLLTKSTFSCPLTHITAFEETLQHVSKIAIVGWRARERHFLQKLSKGLSGDVDVIAVGKDGRDASETIQNLRNAGLKIRKEANPGVGFTTFSVGRILEQWLRSLR